MSFEVGLGLVCLVFFGGYWLFTWPKEMWPRRKR